jgi:hypothetical protein
MAKLASIKPRLRTIETRRIKPEVKRADPELQTVEHQAWARAVKRRAGWRCEAVEDGERCRRAAPRHRMVADHIVERADGGALLDMANGQCLCVAHNTAKGVAARAARLASS